MNGCGKDKQKPLSKNRAIYTIGKKKNSKKGLFVSLVVFALLFSAVYIGMHTTPILGEKIPLLKSFNTQILKSGKYIGKMNTNEKIWVTISLKWRNEPALNDFLKKVNDMRSPYYHHYMSYDEFKKNFAPSSEVYNAILKWIKENGVHVEYTYELHNSITLYDTAANISSLLGVNFGMYKSDGNPNLRNVYFAAENAPLIPAVFEQYINGIDGLNNATKYHLNYYKAASGIDYLSGADVARMYHVYEIYNDSSTGASSTKHIFATGLTVATVLWEGSTSSGEAAPFDPDAVNYYYKHVIPTWVQNLGVMSHVWGHGVGDDCVAPGSNTDGQVSTENELDLEMVGTIAPGVDVACVYANSSQSGFPDLNYDYILNNLTKNTTLVAVSNSWGGNLDVEESSATVSDIKALNAMGVTVLASSGDDGDTDSPSPPSTVALSSYGVVAVGGTTPTPNGYDITSLNDEATMGYNTNLANPRSSEIVWYDISQTGAGGTSSDHWGTQSGVSSAYPEPWFQQEYVNGVISATGKTGRATADVSAMGNHTLIYVSSSSGLSWSAVAGTSVACPVTAGMIAEMAAYVGVQYGASDHGFGYLLPTIYQLGNDFYNNGKYSSSPPFFDVTETPSGYHNGETAYDARTGWDLASGWGVINAWEFVHDIGFTISASTSSASIAQGQTATYNLNIAFPYMWTCDVGHFTVSGLPSGATASTSVSYVHPAGNGTAASITLDISTLLSTPTGTYTLTFTGHSYNHTSGKWGNLTNGVQLTLTINPSNAPDLTITAISTSSSSVNEGTSITIYATVKNVGTQDASNVYVGFYYDTVSASTHIGNASVGSLAAGSSANVQISWDTTGHTGTHTLIAYADPDNLVMETNESNNSATTSVTVNGYGVALNVNTPSETVMPGGSATYTINVKNTGTLQDTFDLSTSSVASGWTATLSSSKVTLDAGASTTVTLTVAAPSSASNGDSQTVTVTAVSEGDSSKSDSVTTTTNVATISITSIQIYAHLNAVINFTTSESVTSYIVYGIGPSYMNMQTPEETTASTQHEIAIQNLTVGVKYFFKIHMSDGTAEAWSEVYNFTLTGFNDFEATDNPTTLHNWSVRAWNYSTGNSEPSIWQWGSPSNVGPSSAYSGSDLIGTVLNGDYGVDEQVQALMTPWIDATNASWVTISFYAWYDLEEDSSGMWDGVTMAFQNNSGTTWWLLDPNNNASQYDGTSVSDEGLSNKYIFGGSSGGWVLKTFNTSAINDQNINRNLLGHKVRFIFYFESDEATHDYPGFYFDDIQIKEGIPQYHIYGTVKDGSGNPVSGATVWVNDTTLGISYQTTTDANGNYNIYTYNGMNGDSINVDAQSGVEKGTNAGTMASNSAEIDITLSAVPELTWAWLIPAILVLGMLVRRKQKS